MRAAQFAEIALEYYYSIFDEYLINIRGCRSAAGLNGYRRPHQKLKVGWYLSFQSMFLNLCSIYVSYVFSNFLSDYIADRLAFPKKNHYLCTIRTCQASLQCSNRRVVFLLYVHEIKFRQAVFLS